MDEGASGNFIVELSVRADRQVNVTLSRSAGTAQGWYFSSFFFFFFLVAYFNLICLARKFSYTGRNDYLMILN